MNENILIFDDLESTQSTGLYGTGFFYAPSIGGFPGSLDQADVHVIIHNGLIPAPFSVSGTFSNIEFRRDQEFIRLEADFKTEIAKKKWDLGQREFSVCEIVGQMLSSLLDLKPSAISVQATYDNSVLFTIIAGKYTGYFEYFIDADLCSLDDPMDEVVLNVFMGKEHVLNFSGEFYRAVEEFTKITQTKNVAIPEIA